MGLLNISGSPHVHGTDSTKKIMYGVIIALMPTFLVSIYYFGLSTILVTLVAVASCLFFEWSIQKFLLKTKSTINDGSAIITGLLLSFNLPSCIPLWIVVIGALVAIGIAKMTYGGLGKNIFNPALVGRVFLLISFPVQMTTFPKPSLPFSTLSFDGLTGPTPLGLLNEKALGNPQAGDYINYLIGNMGGSLGEVSAIAILLGGIFMLCRKIITWHIPVSFIGTAFVFTGILHLINPELYISPIFHILSGGIMLGAIFMATDMVTSPMSRCGQIIFGIGCGIITILIRIWGAYPEGVSFAILLMNAVTPLINKYFKPKKFGKLVKS